MAYDDCAALQLPGHNMLLISLCLRPHYCMARPGREPCCCDTHLALQRLAVLVMCGRARCCIKLAVPVMQANRPGHGGSISKCCCWTASLSESCNANTKGAIYYVAAEQPHQEKEHSTLCLLQAAHEQHRAGSQSCNHCHYEEIYFRTTDKLVCNCISKRVMQCMGATQPEKPNGESPSADEL